MVRSRGRQVSYEGAKPGVQPFEFPLVSTALGFNFYPKSKRYIRPEEAAVIAAAVAL